MQAFSMHMEKLTSANYDREKRVLKKAAILGLATAALIGCEEPPISKGTVYAKTRSETESLSYSIDSKTGRRKSSKENAEGDLRNISQNWTIHIAQCLTEDLPPKYKIEKECKINSFDVPESLYNASQLGQHVDSDKFK